MCKNVLWLMSQYSGSLILSQQNTIDKKCPVGKAYLKYIGCCALYVLLSTCSRYIAQVGQGMNQFYSVDTVRSHNGTQFVVVALL